MRTTFRSGKRTATIGAALTAALTLALTACNGDNGGLGSTQGGPTASADKAGGTGGAGKTDQSAGTGTGGSDQGAGTGTGGSGKGTGSGSGDAGEGKVDMCRSGVLDATATNNTTDETNGVVTVTFKNFGSADCRISGFPGVDIKTSLGDTISVDRNGEQAVPQILKEGDTAAFNITFPVNNTGGSGVKLTDLVVTPPNETEPFTLKWPAGTLAVTDGEDGGKMEISPVGKVSDSPAG
ncbi:MULTISPECIES: DUF4232 domain-containing protein [unclassified Streptomyces]|uniref:DUF4232 domain-containing protein n=1 Tax=unclassified Streptomyces TaxID=2593676 RepID=UPI0006FD7EA4|nr:MULTISPECIES: DUF4232 domain-containing protein [unclassified Streptomyces]KQX59340.1 hypothetical protein ASD33_03370 [Streptomyces sp. Root1304]KRB00601.1 hypothetical protein ASE09_03370 [Streptomyces sp. Root66D1]